VAVGAFAGSSSHKLEGLRFAQTRWTFRDPPTTVEPFMKKRDTPSEGHPSACRVFSESLASAREYREG